MRLQVELDGLTLIFHRPSGMTHVMVPPAPEILDALAAGPADPAEIVERLSEQYGLGGEEAEPIIVARLDELEAAGLVARG